MKIIHINTAGRRLLLCKNDWNWGLVFGIRNKSISES